MVYILFIVMCYILVRFFQQEVCRLDYWTNKIHNNGGIDMKGLGKYLGILVTVVIIVITGIIGFKIMQYQVNINTTDIKKNKEDIIQVGKDIVEIKTLQKTQTENTKEIKQDIKHILREIRK